MYLIANGKCSEDCNADECQKRKAEPILYEKESNVSFISSVQAIKSGKTNLYVIVVHQEHDQTQFMLQGRYILFKNRHSNFLFVQDISKIETDKADRSIKSTLIQSENTQGLSKVQVRRDDIALKPKRFDLTQLID